MHLISIFIDSCVENAVRLNGDVVQVCRESQWGLVCDSTESWLNFPRSAAVVCRQIGMAFRGQMHGYNYCRVNGNALHERR